MRTHDEEAAAALAVQRVVGGTWQLNDTGRDPGLVDVLHDFEDGRRIALEVTSEGASDLRAARNAMTKRTDRGEFAGTSLSHQWHVSLPTTTLVSSLQPGLEEALHAAEAEGLEIVSAIRQPRDRPSRMLARLGVESAVLWDPSPPSGRPKILLGSSFSVIGTTASLPDALERVLARTDNQDKLAAVDADERHLYVRLNDHAAASGLRGIWPLPKCPNDPRGVIDRLWIFAPWASSAFLHRVEPGTDQWEHFAMATGGAVPESALDE
jgi:hypothetical protein